MTCLDLQIISNFSHKLHDILQKFYNHNVCVFIFIQLLSEMFLILNRIKSDKLKNIYLSSCKSVPLQALTVPESSRKLRLPDLVTMVQDGGKFLDLRTGRLNPQEIILVLISVRG